jgi:hypothetical protein
MTEHAISGRWRATRAGAAAAALTVAGILLAATVDMRFLVLAALGTFGPGILRELGWLRDQDEFERQAARRAGYHAYLVGGSVAILAVSTLQAGRTEINGPALTAALVLAAMWLTWLFSSLLAFWGPRRAASGTLVAFGSFWLVFVVLSHAKEPGSLLIEALVVLPFFVLAWMVRRLPRLSGVLLLVVAAATTVLFGFWQLRGRTPEQGLTRALTFVVFEVPLIASGVALLRAGREE